MRTLQVLDIFKFCFGNQYLYRTEGMEKYKYLDKITSECSELVRPILSVAICYSRSENACQSYAPLLLRRERVISPLTKAG